MLDHFAPDGTHFQVIVTLFEELRALRSKSTDEMPSHEFAPSDAEAPQIIQKVERKAKRRPQGWRLILASLTRRLGRSS